MAIKKGLGKGLDSMIPSGAIFNTIKPGQDNVSRETLISINKIEPNRSQPRKNFDEDALQELADSIKIYGIIQPIMLQKNKDFYEIIAGERRWRAARLAGLKEVPAIIKDYSEKEILEISLIENIQRESLNPIEEAIAYQRLIAEFDLKQDEIAERVSKSRVTITNAIRLLRLDSRVQDMVIDGLLTSGHARALIPIEDKEEQINMANLLFDKKLSVRETEKFIKSFLLSKKNNDKDNTKAKIYESDSNLIYKEIEEKIKTIIGSKVQIHRKNENKGKIEIEYYSNEELERIVELFELIS
ncbi:MAG TPA: ParB/RepB/Spo0J family partition protein [Clostridiales bacterium]|nr:ParB/RepB/Spo0J family partition protein [Clostridiales bacterium]